MRERDLAEIDSRAGLREKSGDDLVLPTARLEQFLNPELRGVFEHVLAKILVQVGIQLFETLERVARDHLPVRATVRQMQRAATLERADLDDAPGRIRHATELPEVRQARRVEQGQRGDFTAGILERL